MKIIDLINKKANGEKTPKKIKFMNSIWEYERNGYVQDFQNEIGKCLMEIVPINKNGLNQEVEIIEEPKKMEKLKGYDDNIIDFPIKMKDKINELIDEINKLKEK